MPLPSHLSGYIDHSHDQTHSQSYTINRGQHASGHGIINNINNLSNPSNPLEELEKRCSHSAAFDSAARFDPPRCAESTRLRIVQIIEEWINSDRDTASLFWLHGGAGVGKSALAQSLSEKFQEGTQFGASFFFCRGDPSRQNGNDLIPTLVSQLVDSFEEITPFVEDRIRKNRALFTKKYQFQIRELLVEPLLALKSNGVVFTHPRLIVIDGLDECENPDIQCELLRVIASAILQIPYPLRFLVTSRPEAHITLVFNHDPDLQAITVHRYNLSDDPDADMDIRKFLEEEFEGIRRVHRLGLHLPPAWPDQKSITSLVERSSGHFIYASTVIRYIRSPKHRPDNRLEVILRLRPPREGDQPYAQLDALYTFIFQCVEDRAQLEEICLVLGMLYLQSVIPGCFAETSVLQCTTIERFLEMTPGDLVLLLDSTLSLISIDCGQVRILHKSLFDYLLDLTRGGHLPFNLAQVHTLAATYILKQVILRGVCVSNDFRRFAYHCQYAYLNDTLKDYLHSLEVPAPTSVVIEKFPRRGSDLNSHLQAIAWFFFRTLSREDFDSTGQVHEQYMAKWMAFLHSPVTEKHQVRAAVILDSLKYWLKRKLKPESIFQNFDTESDYVKRNLHTVLMEWKPRNSNKEDVGMHPVRRVEFIKQEHSFFSAYVKASFSGNTDAVVSSLVFGDYFIHSYSFAPVVVQDEDAFFLDLRTYSRHGNASYCITFLECRDVVQKTIDYLTNHEKYLSSEHYQGMDLVSLY